MSSMEEMKKKKEKIVFNTDYKVGEVIQGNAHKASIVFGRKTIEASVLTYPTLLDAEKQRDTLNAFQKNGCSFVASPLFAVSGKDNEGLLFIRTVGLLSSEHCPGKIIDGVCIGLSDIYKNVIQEILFGYHAIHEAFHSLKVLKTGLFFDESGSVKLCNLDTDKFTDESKVNTLVADFEGLKDYINSLGVDAPEIESYVDLLTEFLNADNTEKMKLVKFLYNGAMLWAPNIKAVFIDEMDQMVNDPKLNLKTIFDTGTPEFAIWKDKANLTNFSSSSFLSFVEIKCSHRLPFDEIEKEFPNMCSMLYSSLARGYVYVQYHHYTRTKKYFRDWKYSDSLSYGDYLLDKLSGLQRKRLGLD